MEIRKKVLSLFCAAAMTAVVMPSTTLAAFNGKWFDANTTNGRVEGEYAANIRESNGANESKTRTGAQAGALLRFDNAKNGKYNASNQPYVKYEVFAEKSGIYTMYICSSINPAAMPGTIGFNNNNAWSPYSIEINNQGSFAFEGSIHNISTTPIGTEKKKYGTTLDQFAIYNAPVYLEAGKNEVKFTIIGGRQSDGNSQLEIDYFTFEYKGSNKDSITVDLEEAIGGNAASFTKKSDTAASGGSYYQANSSDFAHGTASSANDLYVDFAVYAPRDGKYSLEFAGSRPSKALSPISITINNDTKIVNYDSSKFDSNGYAGDDSISPDVKAESLSGDFYKFTGNNTVVLKKGLNKVRVQADIAAKNGDNDRYSFYIDYLKFISADSSVVNSIELNLDTQTVAVGESTNASVIAFDETGAAKAGSNISYSSDLTDIASVDDSGKITGNKPGTAVITAEADGKKASKTVYVYDAANPIIVLGGIKTGGGVQVESTVGSLVADSSNTLNTVPTFIAVGSNTGGASFDAAGSAPMQYTKNTPGTGSNPVISLTPVNLNGSYDNITILTWKDLVDINPLYSTITVK